MRRQCPYTNWNDIYSFNDSISKVWGKHNLKAGVYYERTGKVEVQRQPVRTWEATISAASSNMTADTQDGYANAWLGNLNTYSEGGRAIGDYWFTGIEAFVQDNWRVSRRVTLDLGVRFYHLEPQENLNDTTAMFIRTPTIQRPPDGSTIRPAWFPRPTRSCPGAS